MLDYRTYLIATSLLGSVILTGCGSSSGDDPVVVNPGNPVVEGIVDLFTAGRHSGPLNGNCMTCHASEGEALLNTTATATASAEFNLCSGCHQVLSHDNYNLNPAARNSCTQCHEPHAATKFEQVNAEAIALEWSQSGHAAFQNPAFGSNITRPVCLKCHSGPEYARFVDGVPAADLDPVGGAQAVACIACHDLTARDSAGNFALGPIRFVPEVTFPSGAVVSLEPASNLCMECHQGRSSTPTVDARIAAGNLSFANIHYYAAAATLFGSDVQGGYEYPGRTYAGRNTFLIHAQLGEPELTTCTGCHMGDPASHSFEVPLERCTACHDGASFPELEDQPRFNFERIAALKSQLLTVLEDSGVTRVLDANNNHIFPYFENIGTAAQLKAAYNWQVADKEPCGYIHNGIYIRQLLFDSIVDMGVTPLFANP